MVHLKEFSIMNERSIHGEDVKMPLTPKTRLSAKHRKQESKDKIDYDEAINSLRPPSTLYTFSSNSNTGKILTAISPYLISSSSTHRGSTFPSFICLLLVTCANYMLGPMRDAAALAVGVSHIPALTLASTWLALASSVPIGWLFEAPDPRRMNAVWKRFGFTRGETQGTSLALFYRVFAIFLFIYACAFYVVESPTSRVNRFFRFLITPLGERVCSLMTNKIGTAGYATFYLVVHLMKLHSTSLIWGVTSEAMEYEEQAEIREGTVQVVDESHHSQPQRNQTTKGRSRIRLKRLAFVGFGGTMGGILGSTLVSFLAHTLRLSGLLFIAVILLEISANLSIEIGKIMQRHWEEEQRIYMINALREEQAMKERWNTETWPTVSPDEELHEQNNEDLYRRGLDHGDEGLSGTSTLERNISSSSLKNSLGDRDESEKSFNGMRQSKSCGAINGMKGATISAHDLKEIDASLKRTISIGSMKRVASGNSISGLKRIGSQNGMLHKQNLSAMDQNQEIQSSNEKESIPDSITTSSSSSSPPNMPIGQDTNKSYNIGNEQAIDDNTFKQRLLRGVRTIIRSKLLLTIFTYNALYASTSVLLSFQRAQLVANRSENSASTNNAESDTAFLAKINFASSVAVFALQASGLGAYVAHICGQRGTLALMPVVRLCGVLLLTWWHFHGNGKPPNLILFLVLDEFTRVINFAIAKPVRESLWRGLSNEARYEAKPIVDTLANRWGGGSAAFIVGCIDTLLDFVNFGDGEQGNKTIFGFPPTLILLLAIAAWWTGVSAHLGYVRNTIDLELKKQKQQ